MPIESLLVPVDYLPSGDRALLIARRLARIAGIPIELVTVSSPGLSEALDVDQLAERVDSLAPVEAIWTIAHDDDVAAAIVRVIEDRPNALPVIGTSARGPVAELLLGSVSEAVLSSLDRPALFVGPNVDTDTERIERLVVAVSSWSGGAELIEAVTDLVTAFPAAVEMVEVLPPSKMGTAADAADANLVRGMATALQRRSIPAQWSVVHDDDPAQGVVRSAAGQQATLIAAPTTRWATHRRVHAKSTVREIVRHASAPVLVITQPG